MTSSILLMLVCFKDGRRQQQLTLTMPDRNVELDTGETVVVETGDTVIWLVRVVVTGTWLVESPSLPVGV